MPQSDAPPNQGCGNCRFYFWTGANHVKLPSGCCRRYPPTTKQERPPVFSDDWCGEYAAKPADQKIGGLNV